MAYGLITQRDGEILEWAMRTLVQTLWVDPHLTLSVVEVGVCHGDTGRGMKAYFDHLGVPIFYTGIDNGRDRSVEPPFPGASVLVGESSELYMQAPATIDFLMVDGCHCINHVMLDFLHYGDRVVKGGIVVFHDFSPATQNKKDYQGHGPRDSADFGTAAREAIRKLGLPLDDTTQPRRSDWALINFGWGGEDWGGVAVFQRVF